MDEMLDLILKMSPFLLLGFFLAGLMHAFVPGHLYSKYLSKKGFRSVFNAAMFGVPLPLCSCGVIPTAMSLRREGASRGATVSFLIATPQTGVDSIFATYSLLGLPFAIVRPIAALVTALLGGELVNCTSGNETVSGASVIEGDKFKGYTFWQRLREAFHYAFVDMMQDIGKWLVVGLIVAGLITILIPDSFFAMFADKPLLSMLLVLVCAIPMYLCATGSIPIAAALILKGLSPGTALVLLMAGPAVNVASMLIIHKVLGNKTLALYLISIMAGAIMFGLGIDYLLPREWFVPTISATAECCNAGPSWIQVLSAVLLGLFLLNALTLHFRVRAQKNGSCQGSCGSSCCDGPCDESDSCAKPEVSSRIYHVDGMRCHHCAANVQRALESLDSVQSVEVVLETKEVKVTGPVADDEVCAAIESLGYQVIGQPSDGNETPDSICQQRQAEIYHVEGMRCHHCAANVERALNSLEGVEEVEVILETKEVKVKGHVDRESVLNAIESLGYQVVQ